MGRAKKNHPQSWEAGKNGKDHDSEAFLSKWPKHSFLRMRMGLVVVNGPISFKVRFPHYNFVSFN